MTRLGQHVMMLHDATRRSAVARRGGPSTVCTGLYRKTYPSKNCDKIISVCEWKCNEQITFQMATFCFDHESETGFHGSGWTSHYFFVQICPSWLNGCFQWFQIGVWTARDNLLQNRTHSKVHMNDRRTCSISLGNDPCNTSGPHSLCDLNHHPV